MIRFFSRESRFYPYELLRIRSENFFTETYLGFQFFPNFLVILQNLKVKLELKDLNFWFIGGNKHEK